MRDREKTKGAALRGKGAKRGKFKLLTRSTGYVRGNASGVKIVFASGKKRDSSLLDVTEGPTVRTVRYAANLGLSTEETRARAAEAARQVVANHLSTIRLVFATASEVAGILRVSPSQITRWYGRQVPDTANRDRIRRFSDAVALLLQRYPPAAVADWFRAPNIHEMDGGGTPADLIREGKWDTLRAYAEEAVSEAYG